MRNSRIFALCALIALGACSDDVTSGGSGGRLTVKLTDAPGDLEEAFVKIDKIILLRADADSLSSDSERRIVIDTDEDDFIDLLQLSGGKLLEIVSAEAVPEGQYSQLRVVIDEAYVTTKDGSVYATAGADVDADGTLQCPSCSSSGFKVKFSNGGLNIVGNSTVVIDFDAAQSFGHVAGNSGKLVMHPVLRATATTTRFGDIRGTVALATGVTLPVCGGAATKLDVFTPLAVIGGDTLTGTTDTLGVYRISNALPGTYAIGFVKDLTFTNGDSLTFVATPSVTSLALIEGDSASANYSITAATCH